VLKHNREFQLVYRKGKSAHSPILVLFFLPLPETTSIGVGFTAGKKVGNAVRRNRAKRRMRALFRDVSSSLRSGNYVLVAKSTTFDTPYAHLQKALNKMLKQVGAVCE